MQLEPVMMQRHGVAQWLELRRADFYLSIQGHNGSSGYMIELITTEPNPRWPSVTMSRTLYSQHHKGFSEQMAKAKACEVIKAKLGLDLCIVAENERYMAYSPGTVQAYPHLAEDISTDIAHYEPGTRTVRMVPQNYCLIALDRPENDRRFDMDGATVPYRDACRRAYAEYEKDHNHREPEPYPGQWLAWLVSEYIKEDLIKSKA
jgi:hypothetical protein